MFYSKPRIALAFGILLISFYPILVKLLGDLSVVSAFYRTLICSLCLIPFLIFKNVEFPKGKNLLGTLFCGVLFGLDIYCWNLSIEKSSAIQATLLTNLAPLFVGVISFLFLSNKPKFNFWIGSAIALVGMVIFIGWQVFTELSFDLAFLLGILSAICYAIYILLSKNLLSNTQVLPYMLLSNLVATIFLGNINYFNGETFFGFDLYQWTLLIIGGVFCQLLAWYLISYATKFMRATRVSLSLLSQIVFATLLATIFLKEEITLQILIGGLLILIGIGITFIEKNIGEK